MLQNALKDSSIWQTRLCQVSHNCFDDHQFKQGELQSVEEISDVCTQIVVKLFLARIGRPDILVSVNQLMRSVSEMDSGMWQTLGKWFRTFITQTISDKSVIRQTRHSIVDWVHFKILIFLVIMRTQDQPQDVFFVFLGCRTFFPQSVGYSRNKLFSHCSTKLK